MNLEVNQLIDNQLMGRMDINSRCLETRRMPNRGLRNFKYKLNMQKKKIKLDPYFTLYIKVNSERTRDLNVKAKTIKLIEKNIGVKHGFEFGSRFLDMTPKAQLTKEEIEVLMSVLSTM